MTARPSPRVAFGMEALALAQLALDRRLPRVWARSLRVRLDRLGALCRELRGGDRDLAREAVAAFAARVTMEPEAAGRALRDFVLDWTCDVA